MKTRLMVLMVLAGVVFAMPGQAATHLSLVGSANSSNQEIHSASEGTRRLGYGGGALLEFGGKLGIEAGVIWEQRSNLNVLVSQYTYLQVPLALRWHANRLLAFALGGYYAQGVGNPRLDGAASTWAGLGMKKNDYGVLGGLGFHFPLGRGLLFRIEGRYLHGLANLQSNPSGESTTHWQSIQALAGLTFRIGRSR